jgi:hypothetical protein
VVPIPMPYAASSSSRVVTMEIAIAKNGTLVASTSIGVKTRASPTIGAWTSVPVAGVQGREVVAVRSLIFWTPPRAIRLSGRIRSSSIVKKATLR